MIVTFPYIVTLTIGKTAHLLVDTSISVSTAHVPMQLEIVPQMWQLQDLIPFLYDLGDSLLGSHSLCLVMQIHRLLAAYIFYHLFQSHFPTY